MLAFIAGQPTAPVHASPGGCRDGQIATVNGCETVRAVHGHLKRILREARQEYKL